MGSIPRGYLSPMDIDDHLDRRLTTVAEEIGVTSLGETSPDTSLPEEDSSDYGARERSAKRQRKGFLCEACHVTFTEKRALTRHKKTDHHRKQIGLPPDRKHACVVCGKYFTRGHDLKRHQNEQHSDPIPAVPRLPTQSSSSSSDISSEHHSDNLSSRRSVSQASNGTDNTSLYPVAEASPDLHMSPSQITDPHSAHDTIETEDARRRLLRHFRSEPNFSEQTRSARSESSLSDVEDQEDEDDDNGGQGEGREGDVHRITPDFGSSDCSHALSESLNHTYASAGQGSTNTVANSDLLTRLPMTSYDATSLQTTICFVCKGAFEQDSDALLSHLRRHLDDFEGLCRCNICQIDFTHEEDLQRHLQSAAKGHCGFGFPHACMGHHPPSAGDRLGGLSDFDRARLCVQLRNWEQAQLQAYIAEIGELTASRQRRKPARWSDVLRGGTCRDSYSSFAISVNSHATAPCDASAGKTDIGGLQKRLQQMSFGRPGEKVRRLIKPAASDVYTRSIDRLLRKAIKHQDFQKARNLLDQGANPDIVHDCEGPFIAMVLWGTKYISNLYAEHEVDEGIAGKCSVCKISRERFERGSHAVEALLQHNADPNLSGGLRGSPLTTAAWLGKLDIVRLLLTAGAAVQKRDDKYGTALCAAASRAEYDRQKDIVRLLIRKGADVHDRGPEGTALEVAKHRRDYWLRQSMRVDYADDGIRAQISCCDNVVDILKAEESKPFKRSATQPLGGVIKEQVIGAAGSKVTYVRDASMVGKR